MPRCTHSTASAVSLWEESSRLRRPYLSAINFQLLSFTPTVLWYCERVCRVCLFYHLVNVVNNSWVQRGSPTRPCMPAVRRPASCAVRSWRVSAVGAVHPPCRVTDALERHDGRVARELSALTAATDCESLTAFQLFYHWLLFGRHVVLHYVLAYRYCILSAEFW